MIPGIDLLNNLVDILIKFCTGKYAVVGDIDKMFHQIKVREEDINALRFVWRENLDDKLLDYVMLVHLFGKVDSPCIANWVIKQAAELASPKGESAIKQNFYMDDFLKSMPEEKQLAELLHEVISVLNACGFRLNKFISNSHEILKELPKNEISSKYINLDFDSLNAERTLGLVWVIEKDIFTFNPKIKESENTKRGILSTIASIFDPLGIVTPSLIEPKYIIQQLWKEKVDWDEEIPFQWNKRWEAWKKEIENISMVSVPRWFGFHKKATNIIQLHIFCDASKKAYGAVVYLKCLEINLVNHSSCFLLSKSRLNPLGDKGITIPKLEI